MAHILIVEDHPAMQRATISIVQQFGHQTTLAVNGEQAVATAKAEKFDLILMDCNMPVMDGYEATVRLREMEARNELPFTPIIAYTSNDGEAARKACLSAGMDDFLHKPAAPQDLEAMLTLWLNLPS